MTSFVDVRNMVGWVASTGPERIIAGILEYLEQDFARWESFDKTPRVASHTPFGVIELMPTSDHESYAFKYVNGHPSNPARGYQTVTAFGVLADVHNGYPTFLAEMTVLTALRTAATSAFAARLLARPDSEVMAMIGTGSQAEFQALAFRIALGITRLRVYDVDADAIAKFVRNMLPLGFEIEVAGSAAEALAGADVVTTCTADKARSDRRRRRVGAPRDAPQRDRRRLPRQDRARSRDPRPRRRLRRVHAADPHRGRDPGQGAGLPGDRALGGPHGPRRRPHRRRPGHAVRLGRLRHRGLLGAALRARLGGGHAASSSGSTSSPTPTTRRTSSGSSARSPRWAEPMSVQSPSAVVMVRPHHFAPNPQTLADNGFQPTAHGLDLAGSPRRPTTR